MIVLGISEQEDFHRPEIPFRKTREIDNEARISMKAEMKRKFNRNQMRITPWDIQLSSITSLLLHRQRPINIVQKNCALCAEKYFPKVFSVCSNFKMFSVLNLIFLFWFVNIYPKSVYKRHLISKFQVLLEGSSFVASFVEHPVCSNFKMYCVLILVVLFWFVNI